MKNVISDFGAVGDGVTVDTLAFQAAGASGSPVLIPFTSNGYVVDSSISLSPATHFIGEPGTKIIHKGTAPLLQISSSYVKIRDFIVDGINASAPVIQLNTASSSLNDISIEHIKLLNSCGLVVDQVSEHTLTNLRISDITVNSPKGTTININSAISSSFIKYISIDYTGSSSPNYTAINITETNNITGGVMLSHIDILGSNSQSYPNQNGINIGSGEHVSMSDINCIYMGGVGVSLTNSVNFRISNLNVSFCTGSQVVMTTCSDSTINNMMTRGRANGSLSFIVISTYGLIVSSCTRMMFTGCDFKSCGAGIWNNGSTYMVYSGCAMNVNYYYGFISTGSNNSSNITGGMCVANGTCAIYQTAPNQYTTNCFVNGIVSNLSGAGTI